MFRKVLVANRGEIARRVLRTCRRLGIATVAVYSDADADAPHVKEADEAVRIGPAPVKESYLDASAIIAAARATGVEAIHPGYGLLSEKGSFARAVRDAGVVFVGPPPEVLDALGDKMRARQLALAAGTAPVPGVDAPLAVDDVEGAKREATRIGWPVIVKAVSGGGGIGMQVVRDEAALARALETASNRAAQAFGDPRVYLEHCVERPRHVEVQIFCDSKGNAVALGERECSVQRRHQKILEESPSMLFHGEEGELARRDLFGRALAVVKHAGYVGAGTVEFIFDARDVSRPYFLEVNARLQVEHPVTEMCTGVDLVEAQLRVAAGEELPRELREARPRGHAIEVRVYAEEPRKGFVPRPGRIDELEWPPENADLRIEAGVVAGSNVTPYYDPMIAKVIAHAGSREKAIDRLERALALTRIAPIVTNLEFLRAVLADDRFRAGDYDTLFAEALAKAPPHA